MPAVSGRSAAVAAHGGSRAGRRRGHDERNPMTVRATGLTWDVHAAPAEQAVPDGLPPGETQRR